VVSLRATYLFMQFDGWFHKLVLALLSVGLSCCWSLA